MEYRDVIEDSGEAFDAAGDEAAHLLRAIGKPAASLTPLEQQVVSLARHDTLGSLQHPGLVERVLNAVLGFKPGSRPLADPRLEALRRAVVVTRHRKHLPDAQVVELRAEGFETAQVRAIEALAIVA